MRNHYTQPRKNRQEVGGGGGIYSFLNLDMNLRVHLPLKQTKKHQL